ncbi:hypothetical protein NDGK_01951 [Clostridiales bacterium CHKCI001]|nr:hypothetical protein NDGK_01951 [Clostridiales bacterium CHKCI001]
MRYQLKEFEAVIQEVLDSGGEFQLYPRGSSMLPLIREGRDWVMLVQKGKTLHPNDIVLYHRKDGSFVLHRIVKVRSDGYVLCGDNQVQLETGIQDHQIIALVKGIGRKGRQVSNQSLWLRLYEWIWCCLPFRKLYFRILGHRYPKSF